MRLALGCASPAGRTCNQYKPVSGSPAPRSQPAYFDHQRLTSSEVQSLYFYLSSYVYVFQHDGSRIGILCTSIDLFKSRSFCIKRGFCGVCLRRLDPQLAERRECLIRFRSIGSSSLVILVSRRTGLVVGPGLFVVGLCAVRCIRRISILIRIGRCSILG